MQWSVLCMAEMYWCFARPFCAIRAHPSEDMCPIIEEKV